MQPKLLLALKAAGGAAIIHHGSIDGVLGNPTLTAYSAAKGGQQPLTHVIGHRLAQHDIRPSEFFNYGFVAQWRGRHSGA